jgi:hypothetical protein
MIRHSYFGIQIEPPPNNKKPQVTNKGIDRKGLPKKNRHTPKIDAECLLTDLLKPTKEIKADTVYLGFATLAVC